MSHVNRIGNICNMAPNDDKTGVRRMVETLAKQITIDEECSIEEYSPEELIRIQHETHRWLARHLCDRGLANSEFSEGIDYLRDRIGGLRAEYWKIVLHRIFMKRSFIASLKETDIEDELDLYKRMYDSFRFAMRSALNTEGWENEAME